MVHNLGAGHPLLPLRYNLASSPTFQMENVERKFLRDVRLSQIRHNYVSFSHGFQKNFESLLRNVSYSLGCKTFCWAYLWLGHYNVDKFLSSASTIFSKWEEIAVVFEIQQRTKVNPDYNDFVLSSAIGAETQNLSIYLISATPSQALPKRIRSLK